MAGLALATCAAKFWDPTFMLGELLACPEVSSILLDAVVPEPNLAAALLDIPSEYASCPE